MIESKEILQHGGKDDKYKKILKGEGKPEQEFL